MINRISSNIRVLTGTAFCFAVLICLGICAQASAAANYGNLPGIVRVSSLYADNNFIRGTERIEGTGFTVSIPGFETFKFVVTAAHVASGDVQPTEDNVLVEWFDPKSQIFRQSKPMFRFLISGWDVAYLMMNEPDMPLFATYEVSASKYGTEAAKSHPAGIIVPDAKILFNYRYPSTESQSLMRLSERTYLPLVYDYLSPGLSPFTNVSEADFKHIRSKASPTFASIVKYGFSEGQFEWGSYVPFAPGMSGAPILLDLGENSPTGLKVTLLGLAGADSRNFTKSWIIPNEFVTFGIKQMLSYFDSKNQNGGMQLPWRYNIDHVFWRYFNGILFREGSIPQQNLAYREVILDKEFVRGEVGNGTRSDVGNGTRSDVGNGTWISQGLGETVKSLRPGAQYKKGDSVIADVLAFAVSYSGKEYLVAANSGGTQATIALDGLKRQGDPTLHDLKIEPIALEDSQLPELVYARLKRAFHCEENVQLVCSLNAERVVPINAVTQKKATLIASRSNSTLKLSLQLDDQSFELNVVFADSESSASVLTYKPVMTMRAELTKPKLVVEMESLFFDSFDSELPHFAAKIEGEEYWLYGR